MTRIHVGDRTFESLEEAMRVTREESSILEKITYATWWPVRRRANDARRAVKFAYQRVVRGWDDSAVWSIDDHLSKTLGQQLVTMAEIAHGYPGDDYPYEQWVGDLRKHGEALLAYHHDNYDLHGPDWLTIYDPAREALRWVADNLASLWD